MTHVSRSRPLMLAAFTSSIMLGMSIFDGADVTNALRTAIAAVCLLAGGVALEGALGTIWNGTIDRAEACMLGALVGLPLSFFLSQATFADQAGNRALYDGSMRMTGSIGVAIVVLALVKAWRRRRPR